MPPKHEEDHETVTQDMSLATMLQDPHVKDLLRKKTRTERAAIKEALKLAQLEIDAKTPLYEGSNPDHTRPHVTFKLLDIKERFKSTDASLDATLEYLHKVLPKGNLLPRSVDEAKKIVCPLDLPHVRYHACINDCILYRNEYENKTVSNLQRTLIQAWEQGTSKGCMVPSIDSLLATLFRWPEGSKEHDFAQDKKI